MTHDTDGPLLRGPGGGSDYGSLVEKIGKLKEQGCNLLVTGRVSDEDTMKATRRFLGCPEESRKRILTLLDGRSQPAADRLPGDLTTTDQDVHVLDYRDNRFSTTTDGGVQAGPQTPSLPQHDGLAAVQHEVINTIQEFAITSDLAPSELRLSIETLSHLYQNYPQDDVTTFLRTITAVTTEFSGLAHYHLPTESSSQIVENILPHFDAHVELRHRDRLPLEHRWHIPGPDQKTDWYELK
jgi:hypothetical protein